MQPNTPPNRRRRRLFIVLGLVIIALLSGPAAIGWYHLFRSVDPEVSPSPEENFKYGSLSMARGIPLYVLRVLPEVFPDKMPGTNGWRSFGMIVEKGRSEPIGWTVRTVGFPGVTFNCALCHSGTYREAPGAESKLVLGAPAHELDFGAFLKFLSDCAADPRFDPQVVVANIERTTKLSATERWTYQQVIVPGLRKQLIAARGETAWMDRRPAAGCGRNDAFNLLKINILNLPDDGTTGTADMPPIWNQQARQHLPVHWGGGAGRVQEAHLVSAFATVVETSALDQPAFSRVTNFIWQLPPPRFPFAIDAALAAQGKNHFDVHCASCHAGVRLGQIIAAKETGTDARLTAVVSTNLVATINGMNQPPFKFSSWRTTDSYVAAPLDGCWMRAPYLHNGSVPTLWDLLQPVAARPKQFRRGGNVYDPVQLGFLSEARAGRPTFAYDTALPGNGHQGHEYGTTLAEADKHALLEYLKTL